MSPWRRTNEQTNNKVKIELVNKSTKDCWLSQYKNIRHDIGNHCDLDIQTQPQIQTPKRQIDKNPFTLTHMSLGTRISPHYKLGKSRAHNWAPIFVSFPTKTNKRSSKLRYTHKTLDVACQISVLYIFKSKHRNNTEMKICTIESSILGFLRQLPRLWPCSPCPPCEWGVGGLLPPLWSLTMHRGLTTGTRLSLPNALCFHIFSVSYFQCHPQIICL